MAVKVKAARLRAMCLVLACLLVGCAVKNPATVAPISPQQSVMMADHLLAVAANTALKTAIALRDDGKLDPADAAVVRTYAVAAAALADQIATIDSSGEPWPVIRQRVLAAIQAAVFPLLTSGSTDLIIPVAGVMQQMKMAVSQ